MRQVSIAAVVASSMMLGGCQALFGSPSMTARTVAQDSPVIDMSDYFAARLETGRLHLAQGRPTQAIIAFRQASYDPAHAGRAYNGMGVAYAQIGRQDLARRYFTMALAADPQDERFARNLARLDGAPFEEADRPALASSAPAVSSEPLPEIRADAAPESETPGLHRVSSREVQISGAGQLRSDMVVRTARQQGADAAAVTAMTGSRQGYPVRVELPPAASAPRTGYPVRIALADVKVTQRADYPIRIELPDAN